MTPELFHQTNVKRMSSAELAETGACFSDFAGELARDALVDEPWSKVTPPHGRRLQESFEWWALREWARCRDELLARKAQKRERA